jgi:hypothetical protein
MGQRRFEAPAAPLSKGIAPKVSRERFAQRALATWLAAPGRQYEYNEDRFFCAMGC